MEKCYLGIDIGSISTKGVIIDRNNNILASSYLYTEGSPIKAVKRLIKELKSNIDLNKYQVVSVGTTGSARKLIGVLLDASIVKNEITAHATGTTSLYPHARTILEIGGQDSKITILNNGLVVDYAMNTLCAAGTGSFLSSQARRLGIDIKDFGTIAIKSKKPVSIAARCTVFAESDLVHKMQMGYKQEDIIAGLCKAVANNYLNNLAKSKKILPPIVFQGGVSKNIGVVKAFQELLHEDIIVDENSHLMGALGIAILAKRSRIEKPFNFDIDNLEFETKGLECHGCPNYCEIICALINRNIIDSWGNKCEKGSLLVKSH